MTRYVFEEVKLSAQKSGKCLCGKRLVRSTTFSQTINPFNKNAAGQVKNYSEIWKELKAEAEAWKAVPPTHDGPKYWKLPEEQRKKYEAGETIKVAMTCGFEKEMVKAV